LTALTLRKGVYLGITIFAFIFRRLAE